jgi:hypothetical protein
MEVTASFLEERAVSLATVLLTRHPRVLVTQSLRFEGLGFDLQVKITHGNRFSGRFFAVVVKARKKLDGIGRRVGGNRVRLRPELVKALTNSAHVASDLPFPLLFMAFTMDSDSAFFGWLREPSDAARLNTPKVELATEWTSGTHDDVIRIVEAWYDERQGINNQRRSARID